MPYLQKSERAYFSDGANRGGPALALHAASQRAQRGFIPISVSARLGSERLAAKVRKDPVIQAGDLQIHACASGRYFTS